MPAHSTVTYNSLCCYASWFTAWLLCWMNQMGRMFQCKLVPAIGGVSSGFLISINAGIVERWCPFLFLLYRVCRRVKRNITTSNGPIQIFSFIVLNIEHGKYSIQQQLYMCNCLSWIHSVSHNGRLESDDCRRLHSLAVACEKEL